MLVPAGGEVGAEPLLEIGIEDQGARCPQPIRLRGGLVTPRGGHFFAGETIETHRTRIRGVVDEPRVHPKAVSYDDGPPTGSPEEVSAEPWKVGGIDAEQRREGRRQIEQTDG